MTEFDKTKYNTIAALKNLCSYCRENREHVCPVRELALRIENLRGVPIIVNDHLHHVMFN
ncbi:MAG: hypothetical protein M1275_02170 [Patescibacteria group bacterium]|nr:hypothetical protein [Patescibacteria group bacterium]